MGKGETLEVALQGMQDVLPLLRWRKQRCIRIDAVSGGLTKGPKVAALQLIFTVFSRGEDGSMARLTTDDLTRYEGCGRRSVWWCPSLGVIQLPEVPPQANLEILGGVRDVGVSRVKRWLGWAAGGPLGPSLAWDELETDPCLATPRYMEGTLWIATQQAEDDWLWNACIGMQPEEGGTTHQRCHTPKGDKRLGAWAAVYGIWALATLANRKDGASDPDPPLLTTLITWAESLQWFDEDDVHKRWKEGPFNVVNGAQSLVALVSPGPDTDRPTVPSAIERLWSAKPKHGAAFSLAGGRGHLVQTLQPERYGRQDAKARYIPGDLINRWLVGGEMRWHIAATVAPTDLLAEGGTISPVFKQLRTIRWGAEWLLIPIQPMSNHWALLVLHRPRKRGWILDGLRLTTTALVASLPKRLADTMEQLHGGLLRNEQDTSEGMQGMRRWKAALGKDWRWEEDQSAPRQANDTDCGMWVLLMALDILYGRAWSFSQDTVEARREELGIRLGLQGNPSIDGVATCSGMIDGVWSGPRGVQAAPRQLEGVKAPCPGP